MASQRFVDQVRHLLSPGEQAIAVVYGEIGPISGLWSRLPTVVLSIAVIAIGLQGIQGSNGGLRIPLAISVVAIAVLYPLLRRVTNSRSFKIAITDQETVIIGLDVLGQPKRVVERIPGVHLRVTKADGVFLKLQVEGRTYTVHSKGVARLADLGILSRDSE